MGVGLRILSGSVTSPTLAGQIDGLRQRFPELRWHRWEADRSDNAGEGAMLAFGRRVDTVLHVDRADVVLAIESDFLDAAPGHLVHARDFARRRRAAEEGDAGRHEPALRGRKHADAGGRPRRPPVRGKA